VKRRLVAAIAALSLVGAACQQAQASFTPTGPCLADGRAPGVYPQLEAMLPRHIDGRDATRVDSGRSCSPRALGTYARHGVSDIQYAGATWEEGGQDGTVIAVFVTGIGQPKIEQAWVEEFYEAGARASTKTENIEISRQATSGGGTLYRLDTLNDLSLQSVMAWSVGGPVRVVIVATRVAPGADRAGHEERLALALEASRRAPG
jgi:hypothetical protein